MCWNFQKLVKCEHCQLHHIAKILCKRRKTGMLASHIPVCKLNVIQPRVNLPSRERQPNSREQHPSITSPFGDCHRTRYALCWWRRSRWRQNLQVLKLLNAPMPAHCTLRKSIQPTALPRKHLDYFCSRCRLILSMHLPFVSVNNQCSLRSTQLNWFTMNMQAHITICLHAESYKNRPIIFYNRCINKHPKSTNMSYLPI